MFYGGGRISQPKNYDSYLIIQELGKLILK